MTDAVAEFHEVVKDFPTGPLGRRKLRAVDGVSFALRPGEVFGLLGPNRAGKTTLVKMLLSLCRASGGEVYRWGRAARDRATLARVGYVHENPAFPRYLHAEELLRYYGALGGLSAARVQAVAPALLESVGLADRAREPIARFSKGMAQRLAVAQALLNDPDLLVLDEPNEGLDLEGRRMMADLVRRRRELGKTVLIVSHILSEAEALCDRVAVLKAGRLAFLGTVDQLTGEGASTLEDALAGLYGVSRS
jgi:ABC-2 type transport system ATP-binding protein